MAVGSITIPEGRHTAAEVRIPTSDKSQAPSSKSQPLPTAKSQRGSQRVDRAGLGVGGWKLSLGFGTWEWLGFGIWSLGFVRYRSRLRTWILIGVPSRPNDSRNRLIRNRS